MLTGRTKSQSSRARSSMMTWPNGNKFTVKLLSIPGMPHSKFEKVPSAVCEIQVSKFHLFSSFRLCKNCYNSQMCAPIWLKFRTCTRGLKAMPVSNLG